MAETKANSGDIIEDICEECPPGKYCLMKEIVKNSGMTGRLLVQLKCIEKFKFEKSAASGGDIGWEEAHREWIRGGYSEKFRLYYRDGISFRDIYPLIMNRL